PRHRVGERRTGARLDVDRRARQPNPSHHCDGAPDRRPTRPKPRRDGDLLGEQRAVRIRFWGTRGSLPTPGPATARYGGNTSWVEVAGAPADHAIGRDTGSGNR